MPSSLQTSRTPFCSLSRAQGAYSASTAAMGATAWARRIVEAETLCEESERLREGREDVLGKTDVAKVAFVGEDLESSDGLESRGESCTREEENVRTSSIGRAWSTLAGSKRSILRCFRMRLMLATLSRKYASLESGRKSGVMAPLTCASFFSRERDSDPQRLTER